MVACCRVGGTECSSTCMGCFEGGRHYLHYLHHSLTSLVAQTVKHLSTMWETRIQSLGGKIPWRRKWQSTPVLLPRVNSREGTQLYPSTENWIKDLLSMALPIRARPRFPHRQSLSSRGFPEDRQNGNHNHRKTNHNDHLDYSLV